MWWDFSKLKVPHEDKFPFWFFGSEKSPSLVIGSKIRTATWIGSGSSVQTIAMAWETSTMSTTDVKTPNVLQQPVQAAEGAFRP